MSQAWDDLGLDSMVGGTFNLVRDMVSTTLDATMGIIRAVMAVIRGDWGEAWDQIAGVVSGVWGFIWRLIKRVWDGIKETIGGALGVVWRLVRTAFSNMVSFVARIPGLMFRSARGMFSWIANLARSAVGSAIAWIGSLPGKLLGLVGRIGGAAAAIGRSIMDNIGRGISNVAGFIGDVGSKMWNAIRGFLNRNFIDRIRGFGVSVLGHDIRPFSGIPRLHTGGRVPGAPGSEVPALLMAGETVRTEAQERQLQSAIASLTDAAMAGMGGVAASFRGDGGSFGDRATRDGRHGPVINGGLHVVSHDPPRRWLDEGLWRLAGT